MFLCANIRKVMMAVFEKEVPKESFEVFDILNKMCVDWYEESIKNL